MAKLVRRVTSNDEIVGSNPARGNFLFLLLIFVYHVIKPEIKVDEYKKHQMVAE